MKTITMLGGAMALVMAPMLFDGKAWSADATGGTGTVGDVASPPRDCAAIMNPTDRQACQTERDAAKPSAPNTGGGTSNCTAISDITERQNCERARDARGTTRHDQPVNTGSGAAGSASDTGIGSSDVTGSGASRSSLSTRQSNQPDSQVQRQGSDADRLDNRQRSNESQKRGS